MTSARFQALEAGASELRRHLLPSRFDPTGSYLSAERVAARAMSFRVMVHGEIETYFEDRAAEIAKAALASWKAQGFVSRVSMHLLGFSGLEMRLPPDSLKPPGENQAKAWPGLVEIDDRLNRSVSDYVHFVTKNNHGIKEKNLLAILLPIGIPLGTLDELVLTTLDQFGEDRGAAAHGSGSYKVGKGIDPKDEYDRIKKIIASLKPIDEAFDSLLEASRPELAVA